MSNDSNGAAVAAGGGSIGFSTLLGLIFIVLKLTGVISWSWFWVLFPLWIGPAIVATVLLVFGISILVILFKKKKKKGSDNE